MFSNEMVVLVGVTGYLVSGKDTVADYLIGEKGFLHISLSDILREDLKRVGRDVTRENLQQLGNEMRNQLGGSILAERALGRLVKGKNYVISSLGRVDEIIKLKEHGFKIIFVDASAKKRFEWYRLRKRDEDVKTFKEFVKNEKLEKKGGGAQFRELENCRKSADIILMNNSTKKVLYKKTDKILRDIEKRPDWDKYFFGIMDAVSTRATCNRGKAACVIVKDKHILATGYVGSPKGLKHCLEVGCLMEKTLHEDGVEREHCVRTTHAEQNAIAQAAKHGIAIKDATMYINMEPCLSCAKMIINAGIKEVICRKLYHAGQTTRKFLRTAGVKLIVKENIVEKYDRLK